MAEAPSPPTTSAPWRAVARLHERFGWSLGEPRDQPTSTARFLSRDAATAAAVLQVTGGETQPFVICRDARRITALWPSGIVLLDVNLPDGNNINPAGELLAERDVALLFITASADIGTYEAVSTLFRAEIF